MAKEQNSLDLIRAEIADLLAEHADFLEEHDFSLEEFSTHTLKETFVKMRNMYETDSNEHRSLAVESKIKTDLILALDKHFASLDELKDEDAAKADLIDAIDQGINYFSEQEEPPLYTHYADAETIAHMPKFNYVQKAEEVYIDFYIALIDYKLLNKGFNAAMSLDSKILGGKLSDKVLNLDDATEFIFSHLIDGKHSNFNPSLEKAFLKEYKEKLK